jgi:hypothetical protein
VARDRIANVLLARKGRDTVGGAARAAEDIARQAARELLAPLLDAACARLAFVLRRAVDAAAERAGRGGIGRELLQPYTVRHPYFVAACRLACKYEGLLLHTCPQLDELRCLLWHNSSITPQPPGPHPKAFHAALRSAHAAFVSRLESKARELLHHHLDAATSEFALGLMAAGPDAMWLHSGCGGGAAGSGARLASEDGGGGLENVPPEEQENDHTVVSLVCGSTGTVALNSGCPLPLACSMRANGHASAQRLRPQAWHAAPRPPHGRRPCCQHARRSGRPRSAPSPRHPRPATSPASRRPQRRRGAAAAAAGSSLWTTRPARGASPRRSASRRPRGPVRAAAGTRLGLGG